MVKQANENDIPIIEEILLDAVNYLKQSNLENGWNEKNIKWDNLSKDYKIEDFYIAYVNEKHAGIMALTDYDPKYWPQIKKGDSLYLHKLAVKREFRGNNLSKKLIDFAKKYAIKKDINCIRLDCNYHRKKLREIYEHCDFTFVENKIISDKRIMALYAWNK